MKKVIFIFGFIMVLYACSSGGDDNTSENTYDRTALLTNWADNIIVPAYENYQAKVETLSADTNTFTATPTEANLQILRASWLEAYKAYQYVAIYNIGKAEEVSLKESSNTYPANAAGIESNISSGNYNLMLFAQFDKQGFPGLDYLINGLGENDAQIVDFYTANANAAGYKQYLIAVADRLKTNADAVVADWNGGFRDSYVTNNGSSVSSSVNKTINNFIKNMERDIRSAKVGIPAGIMSNGMTFPDKVEGYYKADVSKELLNVSLKASQDFFNGKHFNDATTGPGLKAFLDFVDAVRDGQQLSAIIDNQYDAIFTISNTLDNNFSQQIFTDNSKMLTLYGALQQNTIYTKLDMMQALNVTIDYVDGDGD
jgi:predicted lipoprotein